MNKLLNNTIVRPVKSTRVKKHYVNNAEFLQAIISYKEKLADTRRRNVPDPPLPNYIGECLYNIANRLALKGNFVNYSYREEMVSDGIENCLIYFNNFNPEKTSNPFAYFTQIIYFAFLRRIHKEQRELYIKHKVLERDVIHSGLVEQQSDDIMSTSQLKINNDFINTFVEDFEKKIANKKRIQKEAKNKTGKQVISGVDNED